MSNLPSISMITSASSSISSSSAPRLRSFLAWTTAIGVATSAGYAVYTYLERRRALLLSAQPNQLITLAAKQHRRQYAQHQHLLHNSYFMVRHGESTANVAGIISSSPSISTVDHGLTAFGREQVAKEVEKWQNDLPKNQPIVVISSDFLRAKETAEIILQTLAASPQQHTLLHPSVLLQTSLRERYFGLHNGGPTSGYDTVWASDARSADHQEYEVESVNSVVRRTTRFICEVEERLEEMILAEKEFDSNAEVASSSSAASVSAGAAVNSDASHSSLASSSSSSSASSHPISVILVAHGDVCQILATAFARMDSRKHRTLEHWKNGEMRELKLV